MTTRPPSRVVFVGNIPYNLSEEQITEIFNQAGKVERFRLVYDPETGRPKGFGFADYPDTDSAESAVRNLNDKEILGRKLRVDFSNEPKSTEVDQGSTPHGHASNGASAPSYGAQSTSLPSLPPGTELPANVSCTDVVSRTLSSLPPGQLLDILVQMQTLATNEPQRATELLQQAPQLSYAIFQGLLLLGLVSPEAIQSVIEPGAPPPAQAPPVSYPGAPMPGFPGAPPAVGTTPPVSGMPYPPPGSYGAPAAPPPTLPPDQHALVKAVLELPQAEIDRLDEHEKQQIMALRAQFGGQQR